jgi:phage-related protein
MRKFILYNKDKSLSFDLSTNVVAADPKGLGNKFSLKYLDTNSGRRLTNITPEFEPIQLTLYFNVHGQNGYGFYNNLLTFLAAVGFEKFLFEYSDNVNKKLCEVVLQAAPKTEIKESGEFAETFTFERQTFWFEELKEAFTLKNYTDDGFYFTLPFPFGFSGVYLQREYLVKNEIAVEAPITIRISGGIANPINIYIEEAETHERVAEILLTVGNQEGYEIHIDPAEKKVTQITPNNERNNAYQFLDHNKQSFLYIPRGDYIISSNMADDDTGRIEISIRRYLFD